MIALFFVIYRGPGISLKKEFRDPESFFDKCLKDRIEEKLEVLIPQGGFVNPADYKIYNDTKITYLCKNINYYDSCVMQYPRYLKSVEEEIEREMQEEAENCFISLEEELDKKNYEHSGGDVSVDASLGTGKIDLVVYRDYTITRDDDVRNFDSFKTIIKSSLYNLAWIANEIASSEARFCYFEYVGFDILYNDFDVRKWVMSDSTKIYTIKDKNTGEEMNIAVRGCVIPAGF